MSLARFIEKWKLPLFLVAFLFLRIPPLYLFPLVRNAFLTTQSLARIVFLSLFLWEIYLSLKGRGSLKRLVQKDRLLIVLIFLLLVELSLGVLYAVDIKQFLLRYKDIFLGIVMFFLGVIYGKNLDKIAKVILIGLCFSLAYQAVMFFSPDLFSTIAKVFLYDRHLQLVLGNIDRGRLYIETFDEVIILILIWWLIKRYPDKERFYSIGLFSLVGFFAFVSNFRTRILVLVISVGGYLFYALFKKVKRELAISPKKITLLLFISIAVLLSAVVADSLAVRISGFSFVDRLTFGDEREDVQTISFRIKQLQKSWELAEDNFSFGVGLGNYYETLPFTKSYHLFHSLTRTTPVSGAAEYIHSIIGTFLAEGGYWAAIIFLILTFKFLSDDYQIIKNKAGRASLLVFSFWGIYIYSLFHPFVPFTLQGLFWFLRGLLFTEKQKK